MHEKRRTETATEMKKMLEGKTDPPDTRDPLDRYFETYAADVSKQVNGPPSTENDIDARSSAIVHDMRARRKRWSASTALQGPVMKKVDKGAELKAAIATALEAKANAERMQVDGEEDAEGATGAATKVINRLSKRQKRNLAKKKKRNKGKKGGGYNFYHV